MLVTKPLPEEFSAGHMGRLLRLNAMPAIRATAHKLLRRAAFGASHDEAVSPLHSLAAIVGLDPVAYARRHSLLPFHSHAFRSDQSGYHDHWLLAHFLKFGTSSNTDVALCPECIEEDEDFWGFSFWRREHQINGMRWCMRHGEPLRYIEDRDAFLSTPREWLSRAKGFSENGLYAKAPEALKRFQEMARLMLEQGAPASLSRMRDHIAAHAQANGFVLSECATGHRLASDHVFRVFPKSWLQEVFPKSTRKTPGEYCCVFDNALKPVRSGMTSAPAIAVVLVTLYDAPETAINAIHSKQPPLTPRVVGEESGPQAVPAQAAPAGRFDRKAPPTTLSSRNLARLYIKHHGDHAAIAEELHCSEQSVSDLLAKRRKHVVPAIRKAPEAIALHEFLSGRSLADASRNHGVPLAALEAMLRYLHNQLGAPKSHRYAPPVKSSKARVKEARVPAHGARPENVRGTADAARVSATR